MSLAARLLLDLRRVQQRSNDCSRSNADGDTGLHQLAAAFLVGAIGVIVAICHGRFSMAFRAAWEDA